MTDEFRVSADSPAGELSTFYYIHPDSAWSEWNRKYPEVTGILQSRRVDDWTPVNIEEKPGESDA